MSAAAPARLRPARPSPAAAPPRLRLVRGAPSVAGRVPFVVLVALVLATGLVALLMLHTLAAQDAFTLHDLQRRAAALADAEQQLAVANQQAQAPSTLAARARGLGMVPAGTLRFVRRPDGRLVAVATGIALPVPVAKSTPSPAATPSAAGKTSPAAAPAAKPAAGHKTGTTGRARGTSSPPRRTHGH